MIGDSRGAASEAVIGKLALVGVGLIGGSLMRSLKKAGAVTRIVGTSRTTETLSKAIELGVIDQAETDLQSAVKDADMVVIATPMQAIPPILSRLNECLESHTVVTDVGSVKAYVVNAARKYLYRHANRFVPGHPIAGRENAGVAASTPDLFVDRTVVLSPMEETAADAVSRVEKMWKLTGARVQHIDASLHDTLLASTSHLPHVVAYALVEYLSRQEDASQLFDLAAAGFYDFTRIASSDPVMWRDICLTNRDALIEVMEGYIANAGTLLSAIKSADGEALLSRFEHAKRSRDLGLERKRNIPNSN